MHSFPYLIRPIASQRTPCSPSFFHFPFPFSHFPFPFSLFPFPFSLFLFPLCPISSSLSPFLLSLFHRALDRHRRLDAASPRRCALRQLPQLLAALWRNTTFLLLLGGFAIGTGTAWAVLILEQQVPPPPVSQTRQPNPSAPPVSRPHQPTPPANPASRPRQPTRQPSAVTRQHCSTPARQHVSASAVSTRARKRVSRLLRWHGAPRRPKR